MNRYCLVASLATVLALVASVLLPAPWDIASVVVASASGAAALLLFLSRRS